jgi:hypothetical protein
MTVRVSRSLLLTVPALLMACSGDKPPASNVPISSSSAALTAQENTERALRGLVDSGGFLAESAALADSLSAMAGESTSCSGSYVTPTCAADDNTCVATPVYQEECVTESNPVTVSDLAETRQELNNAINDLVQQLRDKVFTEANLESETETEVTYLLGADVFCEQEAPPTASPGGTDPATVGPASAIDEECAAEVAKLQPRLRLKSPHEGDIDVEVLLSADRRNPITLQLYQSSLGVVFDLGEFNATINALEEPMDGISALDGVVSGEVARNGDRDFSLRFNVLEPVHIVAGDPGEEVTVNLAASSPAAELRFDGNARKITGTYDVGTLKVSAPLGAFFSEEAYDDMGNPVEPKTYTGAVDILLGGLNGGLTFDGNTDILKFTGLGLGDTSTTVRHEDNLLLQLDVNPDQNRRFDLQVQSNGDLAPTLTFSPTLDVRLLLGFQHLLSQVPDMESFLLNDRLRLWFDGDDPSIQPEDNQVRVASGTLHISSETTPSASVDVEAGMCLVSNKVAENEAATSLASAIERKKRRRKKKWRIE